MPRRHRIFPKDLVQFPRKSHCHQIKSVLLPCPPHRISPLWEKDHLSSTEQMSHLNCQAEISSRPVPYTCYTNKLVPSSWLQEHLAIAVPHLTLPGHRAMAVPLPHLQHHKHQEATPALLSHHRRDTKNRVTSVALKPVSQCHIPPLSSKYQLESFVESNSYQAEMPSDLNHLPKIFPKHDHLVAKALIHSNQQPLSSSIADHKAGLSQFLNQRTMIVSRPRTRPDYQAKDILSMPRGHGNQIQTSPRPWSQARAGTADAIEFFHQQHETMVTPEPPCFECWSRPSAMKTLDLDHWVQTKASKGSYPSLHLKETISLLRCIDHPSRTLVRYPISLNQRTTTPNPPNWAKGTLLPSLGPNHQSRLKPTPQSSEISGHWRKPISVPFSLHHHIPDALPQPGHDDQVKDVPAQTDQQETVPPKANVATTLNGHVHWTKPLLSIEQQGIIALGPHHQATPSHSHDHQAEDMPDPNTQIVLQKDLDKWKAGLDQEVTNPIILEQQAMLPQGSLDLQDTTSPSSKNQTTPLAIKDHQVDDMPNSSVLIKLQEEAHNWEIGQDQQTMTPIREGNRTALIPLDIVHHNMILRSVSDCQVISPPNLDFQVEDTSGKNTQGVCPITKDPWETRLPERDLQTIVIIDQGHNVISSLGKDYQDTGLLNSDNPDTPPPSHDYQSQNAPELSDPVIYQQKLEPWEIMSSELDHHVIATINQDQWETLPVDTEHQDAALLDPDDQDTLPSDDDYQDQDEPDSYDSVTVQQKLESSEISSELRYHVTNSVSQDYWQARPLDLDPQATVLPCSDDQDMPPSNYDYQGQDIIDPNDPITCQQKLEPWEISPELGSQITAPTLQDEGAKTAPSIIDPDDVTLSGHKYHATHPLPPEQQLDISEETLAWSGQVQQEQDRWEAMPLTLNYRVMTLGQVPQRVLPLKLEQQVTTPSGPDPSAMSSLRHDDQAMNVTYYLTQPTIQPEQGHGETPSPGVENGKAALTSQDHQEMVPLLDIEYHNTMLSWTTLQPSPSNQNEDLLGSNAQVTFLQKQDNWETIPPGLDYWETPPNSPDSEAEDKQDPTSQFTLQREQDHWENMQHSEGYPCITSPVPEEQALTSLSPDHQDEEIPDYNVQTTISLQTGQYYWETEPARTHQPNIIILPAQDHGEMHPLSLDHKDMSLCPPSPEDVTSSPLTIDYGTNSIPDANAQITVQLPQDFWKTNPLETDHQLEISVTTEHGAIATLGMNPEDTSLPGSQNQAIPLFSSDQDSKEKPDLNDQVTLQSEQDPWRMMLPRMDHQTTTFTGQVSEATLSLDLDSNEGSLPEPEKTTPLPCPHHQTKDHIPDTSAQDLVQTESDPWETMPPEQDSWAILVPQDSQVITFTDQDHPATLPSDLDPQTSFESETQSTTPSPSHQVKDVPGYNAKFSFLTEQGPSQIMPMLGTNHQDTTLMDHDEETIPPPELDNQNTASPDPKPMAILPPNPEQCIIPSLNIDHKTRDIPDTNSQVSVQLELDHWETKPLDIDQQVSTPESQDHKTRPLMDVDPGPNCWVTPPFNPSLQSEAAPEHQTQIISPSNVPHSVEMSVRPYHQVTPPYFHTSILPDPPSIPDYHPETKSDFTTTFPEIAPINLMNNQEANPPTQKYRTIFGHPSGPRNKSEILTGGGDQKLGAGLTSDSVDEIESELLYHTQPEQNRQAPKLLNYVKPDIIEGGESIPTVTVHSIINSIPQQTIKNDICKQILLQRIKELFTQHHGGQISCKYKVCLACASWIPNGCPHIRGIIKYPCGAQLVVIPIVSSSEKDIAVKFVLRCPQTLTYSLSDPPNTSFYRSSHNHPSTFSTFSHASPVTPQSEKSKSLSNFFQPQDRASKTGCQQSPKKSKRNRDEDEPRRGPQRFFRSLLERFQRRQRRN
ncbi:uncharacterized protein [Notamacropus eugenii]|uniref:uncharacterized protein n=1 Tax=Notamacropus eugenii TaxID=9315 RepID=UPI003B680DB9